MRDQNRAFRRTLIRWVIPILAAGAGSQGPAVAAPIVNASHANNPGSTAWALPTALSGIDFPGPGRPSTEPPSQQGIECVISQPEPGNATLDCPAEYAIPTKEPAIAIDPNDPDHIVVASLNQAEPRQTIQIATSFDGGQTWTIGDLPRRTKTQNWDPWLAFDVKRGTVVLSFEHDGLTRCGGYQDQMIAKSADGGVHWGKATLVFPSSRCGTKIGRVFEEGKIATDNDEGSPYYGRMWVTALEYVGCFRPRGFCRAPIAETHSDDGGVSWTRPRTISGSNAAYCTDYDPPQCDVDLASAALPVIGPDGAVHVAFRNYQDLAGNETGETFAGLPDSQLMVVGTTDGGRTWTPPVDVVGLEDGQRDFKRGVNANLSGTNLYGPTETAAYMAVGPTGTLFIAFADNRDGRHDARNPATNTDVFVMSSSEGGRAWTGPDLVAGGIGDQFNPNIAVNPATGKLAIAFYDRSADPNGKTMDVSLATGLPGSFTVTNLTTAASHLSKDLWYASTRPHCFRCVYHIGEYLGVASGSDGTANVVWVDLRRFVTTQTGRSGYGMNVDYERVDKDASAPTG